MSNFSGNKNNEVDRLSDYGDLAGHELSERQLWKLLLFVVLNGFVLNFILISLNDSFVLPHLHVPQVTNLTVSKSFLNGGMGEDSLGTMLPAIHLEEAEPVASPYEVIFFQQHIKFQYPLTSLLPYYFLERMGVSDGRVYRISQVLCWLSICAIVLLVIWIAWRFFSGADVREHNLRCKALLPVTVGLAGLCFYPLMRCFDLGQLQTIITLFFTLAFLCWMSGREKTAGALMGLMALMKPQYVLFLAWALLRRKYGAFVSGLVCLMAGVVVAFAVFGVHNNLDYLRTLQFIERHGESLATNQSMNGLLNRLFFNGDNLGWTGQNFAPYLPVVYLGTVLSSLALLGLAFFYPSQWRPRGGVADFACLALVATMASPVAWEHHYAILLPIFAWLWFGDYAWRAGKLRIFLIALAYVLASNSIVPVAIFASLPVLNVLQSYLYFAAGMVLFLVLRPPKRISFAQIANVV